MPTQTQRRASTRRQLLDAAAQTLVQHGSAGFTIAAVVKNAELSNGALFRHFNTRAELLVATVEHVLERLRDTYTDRLAYLDSRPTVRDLLNLLWTNMSDPRLSAVLEIYTQARTDQQIHAALAPVLLEHSRQLDLITSSVTLHLEGLEAKDAIELRAVAILAMQGLVVSNTASSPMISHDNLIDTLERIFTARMSS